MEGSKGRTVMHFPFLSASDDNIHMGRQEGSLVASESDIFLTLLSAGHLFCFAGSSLRLGAIVSSPQLPIPEDLMLSSHVVWSSAQRDASQTHLQLLFGSECGCSIYCHLPYSSECTLTGVRQPMVPDVLRNPEDPTNCLMAR